MRSLSLFSGIGGIDLACEWAGIKTVAFCEREPFCQKVLQKHWLNIPIYDNVCTLTKERLEADGIGTIDLISAGYPCQPFSHAGKREGAEDDRHLWPEVARLLHEIRPRWFIGENVAGHITLGLDDVLADLESEGYEAQVFVIPACAVNSPQQRYRVFIVAYSDNGLSKPADRKVQAGGLAVGNSGDVDDGSSTRLSQRGQSRFTESYSEAGTRMESKFERCGETLANSQSERCREEGRHQPERPEEWIAGGSEVMADTSGTGREELNTSAESNRPGYSTWSNHAGGAKWAIESGVGRDFTRLSAGMDGSVINPFDGIIEIFNKIQWPAGLGQEQHDWEPPRVATGVKNRVPRLKALGNAVVPWQIYPVLKVIKTIDGMFRRNPTLV